MTSKEVSLILGTSQRHASRLGVLFCGVQSRGRGAKLDWSREQLLKAERIIEDRKDGRGRFTKGQER